MLDLSALIDPPYIAITAIYDERSPSPAPKPPPEIVVITNPPLDLEDQPSDCPVRDIVAIQRNRRLASIAAHFHISES
jgi:hypothetical protein